MSRSVLQYGCIPLRSGKDVLGNGQLPGAMPRQELINTVDGTIGDVGRADQRVDGGRTFAAAVGGSEQVLAPTDGDATQCLNSAG